MALRDDILKTAGDLLDADAFTDYSPNGMQVLGAETVTKIATGVSASVELFERAVAQGAQLVICHHGLFWKTTPQVIGVTMRARLRILLQHDITLAGYHLPLDAHPEIGNNAILARGLGLAVSATPFAIFSGRAIGVVGSLAEPLNLQTLTDRLSRLTDRTALCVGAALDTVRTVAVCSGGAAGELAEAAALGADVLITGEASEPSMAEARELGVALIAGGHYATETFGIRALGDLLGRQHGVEHEFHHIPNPV